MRVLLPVLTLSPLLAGCAEFNLQGLGAEVPPDGFDLDEVVRICNFRYGPRTLDTLETCSEFVVGDFDPAIEWEGGRGKSMRALPVVADLDGDDLPEVIANLTNSLPAAGKGALVVYEGDGSGEHCRDDDARLGYASSPAVADLDGDGKPEIVSVRADKQQVPTARLNQTAYRVVAWSNGCVEQWESEPFDRTHFDYASSVVVSDMDKDGDPEIVAGRVILHADGTVRGIGPHGHGSWGALPGLPPVLGGDGTPVTEAAIPAVVDLDLDGIEEVIVGNAMYTPDGDVKWYAGPSALLNPAIPRMDGIVGVANLDDDPEGEFVVTTYATLRAHDTNGDLLWGPIELDPSQGQGDEETGNIAAPPAIGDLDADGFPEIVTAAGNELSAFNHDGSKLWEIPVQDLTGATGAAIFDFEGDGADEVVYIDEQALYAIDGSTGFVKLRSDRHSSETMMDYPVIADVDADDEAELLVAHTLLGPAFTVYGSGGGKWAPARPLWNQHAYSRDNIEDDLGVPTSGDPGFTTHNTWHGATDRSLYEIEPKFDLQVALHEVCEEECALGRAWVAVQPINRTPRPVESGVAVTLYAQIDGENVEVETKFTEEAIPAGRSGELMLFAVDSRAARRSAGFIATINEGDVFAECNTDDNAAGLPGSSCR